MDSATIELPTGTKVFVDIMKIDEDISLHILGDSTYLTINTGVS